MAQGDQIQGTSSTMQVPQIDFMDTLLTLTRQQGTFRLPWLIWQLHGLVGATTLSRPRWARGTMT